MKNIILFSLLLFAIYFISITTVYSQDAEYMKVYALSDSLIKIAFGPTYDVGGVLDVDHIMAMSKEESHQEGYIFEDSKNQLQHCLIFCYGKWDSIGEKTSHSSGRAFNDTSGVGIIRDRKIIWLSKRMIHRCMGGLYVCGFADLNNDGITDIICAEGVPKYESLWLITPSHQGGRLLNAVDDYGCSVIEGAEGTFEILNSGKNKIKIIRAIIPESENLKKVTYILQDSLYSQIGIK